MEIQSDRDNRSESEVRGWLHRHLIEELVDQKRNEEISDDSERLQEICNNDGAIRIIKRFQEFYDGNELAA